MSQRPGPPSAPLQEPPPYRKYRARRGFLRRGDGGLPGGEPSSDGGGRRLGRRVTPKRVILWLVAVIVGWLLLSLALFLISAAIGSGAIPDSAKQALAGGGSPPFSATTILELGSDQRPKGSKEPGATTSGPSRSDSIMLMRIGGGHNSRLSIPRDTVVHIPGHGLQKINAAYAIGGPALTVRTVEQFLHIRIDHVVLVSFTNFPKLIDAMGGINYTGGCVYARVDGGYKNGGVTLHLRKGTHHLDGKQALALARVRENRCNPAENELSRERRQQKIIQDMKGRLTSPWTFLRLPWVAWAAPRAFQSDMGGPTLLGLFTSLATSGNAPARILPVQPASSPAYAGLGDVLAPTSDAAVRAAVRRFLEG